MTPRGINNIQVEYNKYRISEVETNMEKFGRDRQYFALRIFFLNWHSSNDRFTMKLTLLKFQGL